MLDAYIIDRIRRERDQAQRRSSQVPLYSDPTPEVPEEPSEPRQRREPESPDRGSVVIDFQL